ncbi:hypothetical protein [Pyrodictium delaneyi]|uniref:Uncharacterized protein n=1 Tax=Pyrodictium delaneyi TaxID=1273541 RepID=A0A211YPF8_9CREN|nr:hypothetical protein [Pyrodictium delaneyi]OWJ54928.1 hypothetical protein Pdsh_04295 [Pyrodictium delaneyi]
MPVVQSQTTQTQQGLGPGNSAVASGPVAAIQHVLRRLQLIVGHEYAKLARLNTCSHEFLDFVDKLEEAADREMQYRGFEKLPAPAARGRVDLVLGWYQGEGFIVELGLRGLNRCGVLEELAGSEPPRVYARFYIGGRVAFILEASEEKDTTLAETGYIM